MKIVYDHQIFGRQFGGIPRYIYEIATRIAKKDNFNIKIFGGLYTNKYLQDCPSDILVGLPVPLIHKTSRIREKLNDELAKVWLNQQKPDIVHETYYHRKKFAPEKSKTVITVYDMIHEKFSSYFSDLAKSLSIEVKHQAIKRADRVICISEQTRKDLLELINIDPEKVSVIYLGASFKFNSNASENRVSLSKPYILYVGRRGAYKNFPRLLKAYASSNQFKNNFQLICFGGGSFSKGERSLIDELGLDGSQVSYVSGDDESLANYYRQASVFVYPSLYEGFGIPLLESMSMECPIACSNASSFPEVAKNSVEYFDPYDVESIANALEKVLFSSDRSKELVKLGTERLKLFSWEATAEQTELVYRSLE